MPKPTPKPLPLETPIQPPATNPEPPDASTPPTSVSGVQGISTEEAERLKLPSDPPLDNKPAELRTPLPDLVCSVDPNSVLKFSEVGTRELLSPHIIAMAKGIKALFEMTGHQIPGDIRASIEGMAAGKSFPAE